MSILAALPAGSAELQLVGASSEEANVLRPVVEKINANLRQSPAPNSLAMLVAANAHEFWAGVPLGIRAPLMYSISEHLLRAGTATTTDREVIRQVVRLGLEGAGEARLPMEMALLGQLTQTTLRVSGLELNSTRLESAESWLAAWNRLHMEFSRPPEQARELEADFHERGPRVFLNMMPPFHKASPGAAPQLYTSGMAPEGIKDPSVRAEYERMLAKNTKNARTLSDTVFRIRDYGQFGQQAERTLVSLYSRPPLAPQELATLLQKHVRSPEALAKLADRLNQKLPPAARFSLPDPQDAKERRMPRLVSHPPGVNPFWERHAPAGGAPKVLGKPNAIVSGTNPSWSLVAGPNELARVEIGTVAIGSGATESSSYTWLVLTAAAGVILVVLWRAQARGHPGRGK
ncbi:MAG: hypothetical protein ABMA26_11960 [Limisphaerales bacterium]